MAPIISMACFSRINGPIDATMGPTPYWMERIFFLTSLSAFRSKARTTRNLASKETPTIMEFPPAFNEEALHAVEGPQFSPANLGFLRCYRVRRIMAGERQPISEESATASQRISHAEHTGPLPHAHRVTVVNRKLHRE